MKLRIRDKDRIHAITALNEHSTLKELKEEITKLTDIPPLHQECMKKVFFCLALY
jgi:hypothetical protein